MALIKKMRSTLLAPFCLSRSVKILEQKIISYQKDHFLGWPTVAIDSKETLFIGYSGDRKRHVDPFGKNYLIKSHDLGKTWQEPRLVYDSSLDDRDAGLLILPDDTLLYSTFNSNYFKTHLNGLVKIYGKSILKEWKEALKIEEPEISTLLISKNGGEAFETPIDIPISSPHGPILGVDGMYYIGNHRKNAEIQLYRSKTGRDWQLKSRCFKSNLIQNYHLCEPHLIQLDPSTFLALFRCNQRKKRLRTLFESWSYDGGETWSYPKNLNLRGYPPHLLRLKSGKILLSYADRCWPYSIKLAISETGKNWVQLGRIYLGFHQDLGYPSTVELPDQSLFTVFYDNGALLSVRSLTK